jgi:class 3 adenylate cyclase
MALAFRAMTGRHLGPSARRARGVRLVWIAVVAWLALAAVAAAGAPSVVRGSVAPEALLRASSAGVPLDGEWRVTLEGDFEAALAATPPETDFVALPWAEGHHRTRAGADVDAARWAVLSLRFDLPRDAPAYALRLGEISESYYAECRSDDGVRDRSAVGLTDPSVPSRFEANWGRGAVAVTGPTTCALLVPRASLGRIRVLAAPILVAVHVNAFTFGRDGALAIASIVLLATASALAALLATLDRRDAVPRWAALVTGAHALRTFLVTKGEFLPPELLARGGDWAAFRVEYALLAVTFYGAVRYIEGIAEARVPASRAYPWALGSFGALALVGSYDLNRRLLPAFQLVGVAGFLSAFVLNVQRRNRSRSARWSLYGVLVLVFGTGAEVLFITLFGRTSTTLELIAGSEPLFQMAVLSLRAAENRARAERFARATTHFVPKQFLQALGHDDVTTAKLGDASARDMTMLFSDIRDFTTLSERMAPAETFDFLNECLSRMGPQVRANRGFVDKYQGDAIMALFPDSPADAVRAGVAMQVEAEAWNRRYPDRPPLVIGVGIHTGPVTMGTIGESERFEATVIGDAVNLTARLESLTKSLGAPILVTDPVAAHLPAELRRDTRFLGVFAVKGKSQGIGVHEVFASDPEDLRAKKRAGVERLAQAQALFKRGEIVEALTILGMLAEATPGDGAVRWWLHHVQSDLAQTSPMSRRDVVVLASK